MINGIIGPHTSIDSPLAEGGTTASTASESSRDTGRTTAGKAVENSRSLLKTDAARNEKDPARLAQAAQEFESLLLAHLLRTVRESGSGGWLGSSGGQGMSSTMELAEAQLARAMAQSGALGLSKLLVEKTVAEPTQETAASHPSAPAESANVRFDRGKR